MCGRFSLAVSQADLFDEFGLPEVPFDYRPRYNIAPTQPVLALRLREGVPRLGFLRWGLIPHWAPGPATGSRLINARIETVASRPAFRDPLRWRRCLLLADGFYEWKREGSGSAPFRVRLPSARPFAFAGLWDRWRAPDSELVGSCAILTTRANDCIRPIHGRMPVILGDAATREAWLDPEVDTQSLLRRVDAAASALDLHAYPVSRLVNSPDNDSPECLEPL